MQDHPHHLHAHHRHSHGGGNHGDHGHAGGHAHAGHDHAPKSFGPAFAIGTVLNGGFVVVEAAFGLLSNSTALLADAGHNLADVLGLLMAWGASHLATWAPSARYTWGMRNTSVLAALSNAVLLFVGAGAIGWEAVHQLIRPEPVAGKVVMAVAAVGIVVNGGTALLFMRGREHDLNVRGAFLHMAADALVSAGVLLSGLIVATTGWSRADPLVGLAVAVFIVWSTWGLFRDSLALSLGGVPRSVDAGAVRSWLANQPGVAGLHDFHIWPIGTTEVALSVHLVMPGGHPGDAFLREIAEALHRRGIGHATVQVETDGTNCLLAPENVI